MQMRAEHFALAYTEDFSKAKAIEAGKALVNDLLERGEVDEYKVWSSIVRLKEVANSADKQFRERLTINEKQSANGVSFTPKNGAKKLNYTEDLVYNELVAKVKAREDLLKAAQSSTVFDEDGTEVPKVGFRFDSPSVTISF